MNIHEKIKQQETFREQSSHLLYDFYLPHRLEQPAACCVWGTCCACLCLISSAFALASDDPNVSSTWPGCIGRGCVKSILKNSGALNWSWPWAMFTSRCALVLAFSPSLAWLIPPMDIDLSISSLWFAFTGSSLIVAKVSVVQELLALCQVPLERLAQA